LGQALDDPLVVAVAEVRIGQQLLTLRAAAVELGAFAGGSRALPVTVVPALELTPRDLQLIVPVSGDQALIGCDVMVRCIAPADAPKSVSLSAPRGWTVEPSQIETQFDAAGESRTLQFRVRVPGDVPPGAYELAYSGVKLDPVRLGAPGAPGEVDEQSCIAEVNLVRPAVVKVNFVDADFVRTLRYGYVRGMDEEVISSLGRFDIDVTTLGDDDLRYGDLHSFDAIVIGPNAYNLSGELRRRAKRLLDYVAEGGTLLVLYQGYGYDAPGLAPYPFRFHQPHDRVTDPAARVELVDPKCPILSAPNTIEQADFDGWVHDRGLYFFGEWDRRYTPVLAMHDAGEPPIQGGLLTTSYGQGTYIYAGLSFHRQIPAGVRGAIRLFANALGLAEARVRERMERLRGLELFGYMDEEQLYAAARSVSERWIDAGRIFARQGDPGRELFVVVEGTVEVVMHRPAGERLLHVAQAGESLGELALLAGTPRSASLRASTDVIVLVLRAEALDDWLQHHPDLSRRLLRMLARKILSDDAST
jgi:hypothetical protein